MTDNAEAQRFDAPFRRHDERIFMEDFAAELTERYKVPIRADSISVLCTILSRSHHRVDDADNG